MGGICQLENGRKHVPSIGALWREGSKFESMNEWKTENNVFECWSALKEVADDEAGRIVFVYISQETVEN